MSILRKIELERDEVLITLKLTKKEYETIGPEMREFVVLPVRGFRKKLTTGKLGNGNRVMIPNKFLDENEIEILKKKVNAKIIDVENGKFLIVELDSKGTDAPVFEE